MNGENYVWVSYTMNRGNEKDLQNICQEASKDWDYAGDTGTDRTLKINVILSVMSESNMFKWEKRLNQYENYE